MTPYWFLAGGREKGMSGRIQGRCGAIYAILALGLSWCFPLSAANQFFVEQKDLLAGLTGQTFFLQCENDQPLYAFSMILKYDPLKLKITALDLNGLVINLKVCGATLVRDAVDGFLLEADKKALRVVAPACGTVGWDLSSHVPLPIRDASQAAPSRRRFRSDARRRAPALRLGYSPAKFRKSHPWFLGNQSPYPFSREAVK